MSMFKLIVVILLLSTVQTEEPDLTDKKINVTVEPKNDIVETGNNLVPSVISHLNSSDHFNETKTFIDNAYNSVEKNGIGWWPVINKVYFIINL